MKVLQPATKYKDFEHTCACGATLLVEEKDVWHKEASGDQRDYEPESYWANCPECFQSFRVDEKKVPPVLKVKLRNSHRHFDARD